MSRKGRVLSVLIGLIVLLALGLFILLAWVPGILPEWTGERQLREQVKGLGALMLIRLERPSPQVDPYVPILHAGVNPHGINTFLEQEVDDWKIHRTFRLIRDAGFKWIRQEFPWEDIEIEGKGIFRDHRQGRDMSSWVKYDHIVDLAEEYGIEIIARLDNPPAWSRATGNEAGTLAPPDDYDDYGDFVYAVVSRYEGRIKYYQIWNEPNIYPEWGEGPVDPEAYTELLKVAYTRAKQADPEAVILSAGLAPTTEMTPENLMDLVFLERMYEAGAKEYFDIMSVQGYGLWNGPTDRRVHPNRANFSRVMLIRELMVRNGDAHKPIWASEVGWNALPRDFEGFPTYGRVSEELQAEYSASAYERAQREWPWMGVMSYWFFKRASDHEKNQAFYYFRMMEPDFYAYPVYDALKEQASSPPMLGLGYHQEDHWALHYEGSWEEVIDERAVLGGYRATDNAGDALSFTFWGTDLSLVPVRGTDRGRLEITLDGRQTTLDLQSSESEYQVEVPVATGLAEGEHDVFLAVAESPDGISRAAIDAIIVRRSPTFLLHRSLALAVCFSLAIVLLYGLWRYWLR
ncbi:MAG: hypothetical protein GTO63_04920 [Anaerolineae bacterium]|nr:hypothetical protein [Anaerolineae bacterium]NIN94347.1 hypothetical protein [Anaerolineae bacterium]NIQ77410.1 hypothetical protein [Anaerolineae bacterium]